MRGKSMGFSCALTPRPKCFLFWARGEGSLSHHSTESTPPPTRFLPVLKNPHSPLSRMHHPPFDAAHFSVFYAAFEIHNSQSLQNTIHFLHACDLFLAQDESHLTALPAGERMKNDQHQTNVERD